MTKITPDQRMAASMAVIAEELDTFITAIYTQVSEYEETFDVPAMDTLGFARAHQEMFDALGVNPEPGHKFPALNHSMKIERYSEI